MFANGSTEPDERADRTAVLVTQQATGGNDSTITNDSVLEGNLVVNGQVNIGIDGGSRVEGNIEASAGTISLNDSTVTGSVGIGDGGRIDQIGGDTVIKGDVWVEDGGTLDVSGPGTVKNDVIVESGGTASLGDLTVEGDVERR